MSGVQGKASRRVPAESVGELNRKDKMNNLTQMQGEIVDFDPTTQEATVKLRWKPTVNGEQIEPPLLKKVRVNQPRGGGFSSTLPMGAGDPVTLNFDSRDQSTSYNDGGQQASGSDRIGSFSDAVATPAGASSTEALSNYDADNAFWGTADGISGLRVGTDGKLALEGPAGDDIMSILFELLSLLASDKLDIKVGSSIGQLHALEKQADYQALAARVEAIKLR